MSLRERKRGNDHVFNLRGQQDGSKQGQGEGGAQATLGDLFLLAIEGLSSLFGAMGGLLLTIEPSGKL